MKELASNIGALRKDVNEFANGMLLLSGPYNFDVQGFKKYLSEETLKAWQESDEKVFGGKVGKVVAIPLFLGVHVALWTALKSIDDFFGSVASLTGGKDTSWKEWEKEWLSRSSKTPLTAGTNT